MGYTCGIMNNDCKCNKTNVFGLNHIKGTRLLSPKCDKPGIFFTTELIPKNMGTSESGQPFAPRNGAFFNTLVVYQADGGRFLYDSEGNYTELTGATTEEIREIIEQTVGDMVSEEELEAAINGVEQQIEDLKNAPDVVDIVATYADLENYDTSTLTDKDVIRVLEDETHDGDSTYYRWNQENSEWVYIGAIPIAANTIFYANTAETGATRHIYKKPNMTEAVSVLDIIEANEKGQVILRQSTAAYPETYNDAYLQNTFIVPNNNDYEFLFLNNNTYLNYFASATTDTSFGYDDSQIQFKLTAGTNVQISGTTISATDTTYATFTGTDGISAGTSGLVPAPTALDGDKVLKGDGTWGTTSAPVITMTTTDPGEGSPLPDNHFVGVYTAS